MLTFIFISVNIIQQEMIASILSVTLLFLIPLTPNIYNYCLNIIQIESRIMSWLSKKILVGVN